MVKAIEAEIQINRFICSNDSAVKIQRMAFSKVLDSVDKDKAMQVAEKLQAQLPPQVRDIFAILQTI